MDEKFVNVYIEKVMKKLEDLNRANIMQETHLELIAQVNTTLNAEIENLRKRIDDLSAQLRVAVSAREQEPGITDRKIRQKIKEASTPPDSF